MVLAANRRVRNLNHHRMTKEALNLRHPQAALDTCRFRLY
jgi:hypothetical protein